MKKIFTLIALSSLTMFISCTEETVDPGTPDVSVNEVISGAIL